MKTELYFLGAGKPKSGNKPAALKYIAKNTKAMDWQLHSFETIVKLKDSYFLGGYHVDEVINAYPELNFSVSPDWETTSSLNTLLKAPFSADRVVITYSDTLFRAETIHELDAQVDDVCIVIDSKWLNRYQGRSKEDIAAAETIIVAGSEVEFTGLLKLSSNAVKLVNQIKQNNMAASIGRNILDLANFLRESGLSISYIDVLGDWTEFNSQYDITNFIFGTKSETLSRLENVVKHSHIGKQFSFTAQDWNVSQASVVKSIRRIFPNTKLVIRSSSKAEDNWDSSNAGGFESILNVSSQANEDIIEAVNTVVDSYGEYAEGTDQILVQEFLQNVEMAGVVFTCTLESGAPYYRFNFDDKSKSTESVTAGTKADLRTVIVNKTNKDAIDNCAPELKNVLTAVSELESLLGYDKLDIEFAVDTDGVVHIFQVRPVVVNHDNYDLEPKQISDSLASDVARFKQLQSKSPCCSGEFTIFANMPDWNPAEIISTRPKPLAFSLYQHLITNDTWAVQRAEFGYKDVRPAPLIVGFSGQPYVDVRVSFNSFIPSTITPSVQNRIVNAYLNILKDNPEYHDKIEFDVAFTIWTPGFKFEAEKRLLPYGVTNSDIDELDKGLKKITKQALVRLNTDIISIDELAERLDSIEKSELTELDRAYFLLDDCKRYGTLAFSHAARAGFVAKSLIDSLISKRYLSKERALAFQNSFETVAGEFEADKQGYLNNEILVKDLIKTYGHLRPGTYEITTQAYWEDPKQYLIPNTDFVYESHGQEMEFTLQEVEGIQQFLTELGSDITPNELILFLKQAIQQREKVKFKFTKNLSKAMDYIAMWATGMGISREDASFLNYGDILECRLSSVRKEKLIERITKRLSEYQVTKAVELPSVIVKETDFYSFERHASLPNYIGINSITTSVIELDNKIHDCLKGKIVMIQQADPGYDWLFGQDIAGLITQYGGANSHMAIRSAEIGLPAAIGVGDKIYDSLLTAKVIELDCLGQLIRVIE